MPPTTPAPGHGPDEYLFITPVWGEAYVERFVKLSLRTQLSDGNLGAVPPGKGRYLIFTRREHARAITRSAAFRQLKALMPAVVQSLDDLPDPRFGEHPHDLQTAAYMRGIRAGAGRETAFVFLTPDHLFGDGTIRSMVRQTEGGKRVVMVAPIRMTTEGATVCVASHRAIGRADAPIPARKLVRALLDNLHPISRGHLVTDGRFHIPQHLYWPVGDHGLHARGFHLHPLLVWPRDAEAGIRNTLDDEYIERACPDQADWYTATDSDEMCVLEFSERAHKLGMVAGPPMHDDRGILQFMTNQTTRAHRAHVREHIRYHTGDVDPAEWADPAAQSDQLVNRFFDLYEKSLADVQMTANQILPVPVPAPPPLPSPGKAAVKGLVRTLAGPVRFLYRLLNYPLYRYTDRLNAKVIHLQALNDQTRALLTALGDRVDELARAQKAAAGTPRTRPRGGSRKSQQLATRRDGQ